MRLLESCAPAWPAQDLQAQILSLRQAFSADLSKPFELKAVLPPSAGFDVFSSPSPGPDSYDRNIVAIPHDQIHHFHTQPMTPPISAAGNCDDGRDNSLAASSLTMLATGRSTSLPGSEIEDHAGSWNPTRLFEYANKFYFTLDKQLTIAIVSGIALLVHHLPLIYRGHLALLNLHTVLQLQSRPTTSLFSMILFPNPPFPLRRT